MTLVQGTKTGSYMQKIQIKHMPIDSLTAYSMNSRQHSEKQIQQICDSINEFGFTNPILVDNDGLIIAGHGRLEAAKRLELKEVPTILLDGLSEAQKKAYVIADNKLALNASWNEKMLLRELYALEQTDLNLTLTGFDSKELNDLLAIDLPEDEDIEGEIVFSEELGESHNYVVLYFDNDIDWLSAQTHFNLESVHSKRANGKPWSKGVGRVINGGSYLKELKQ